MLEKCSFRDASFHEDDRRQSFTDLFPDCKFGQVNISYIPPNNSVVAFHYHLKQTDYWFLIKGSLKVGLADVYDYDVPKQSECDNLRFEYLSDKNPRVLKIPPLVAHGYQNVSGEPAILLYYLSEKYNSGADEYRIPWSYFGERSWEVKNK